ncbi:MULTISPECIES: sensor histidine kinase [Zhongshania]|uniref:Two-component system sensor histidine kinase AlgZ n=1 Tax=Zhongshania antarctica TaxID=641702 RepID=A0A840R2E0_9GAMM|nr:MULTISPECIES: histidine kinase [Zhongshania]MBB5186622.1 two-component system sensor histidine kinase AlgZ [Zhongshania antarctica]
MQRREADKPLDYRISRISFIGDLLSPQALLLIVLLAVLLSLSLTILKSGLQHFDWYLLGMSGMYIIWCLLGAATILTWCKPLFQRTSTAYTAGISFVIGLCWVVIVTVAAQWLASGVMQGEAWNINFWQIADTLAVASLLLGVGMRYAYLSLQFRLREQSILHARLDALHSRIRPHFLFNTLNSISSLISTEPVKAEQAVEDLAALFRANLQGGMSMVPWVEERDLCERYLRIENARLGDRLKVDWQQAELGDKVLVPSLLLQPLLENAILHGVQQLPAGGTVVVRASLKGEMVEIDISNPLPTNADAPAGNGMANENIRLRLQTLFGDRAKFGASRDGSQYRAHASFPLAYERRAMAR